MPRFDDKSKPHYQHHKRKHKSKDEPQSTPVLNFIQNQQSLEQQNKAANTIASVLMRNLNITNSADLQSFINQERNGVNPNAESALKQVLEMDGITLNPDILYGQSISMDVRKRFEELGMSPDSENLLREFFEQNGIDDLSPEKEPPKPKVS